MDQKSIISSAENDVIFPLTLSQAVQYLATQRTENIHELDNKEKNKIYNKTWQHLSVRLRLIFKKFPKTIIKITFIHDPNRMNLIGKALLYSGKEDAKRCISFLMAANVSSIACSWRIACETNSFVDSHIGKSPTFPQASA